MAVRPKWELGATVRAFSGFPRTPVLGLRLAAKETDDGRLVPALDAEGRYVYETHTFVALGMFGQENNISHAPIDAQGPHDVSNPDHARTLQLLKRKRTAVNVDFPTYDSLIGDSLFLLLCEYHVSGEAARLKDIYLELGRSQGGVRRLLRRLVSDGWVEVSRSEGDQRNRLVNITPKLQRTMEQYLHTLQG